MKKILVYSTDYCPYCRQAEALLTRKGFPFESIDVTNDPAMRDKLVKLTAGLMTVPQIFIDGKSIGGFSDLAKLNQSGQLDQLVQVGA
jgi:glutaredoxin 3